MSDDDHSASDEEVEGEVEQVTDLSNRCVFLLLESHYICIACVQLGV